MRIHKARQAVPLKCDPVYNSCFTPDKLKLYFSIKKSVPFKKTDEESSTSENRYSDFACHPELTKRKYEK